MNRTGKKTDNRQDEMHPEKPEIGHMGQYLQKLRTEKGLTVKDVSHATRISEININAIENQDFAALPADTFTRGFLAIYARLLGLDPKDVVNPFMQERETKKAGGKKPKTKQPRKILSPKTLAEPSHFSSMTAAIILFIIIVFLFTAFCLYTSWNPFSFLTDKESSFQSIMSSLAPGPTSNPVLSSPGIQIDKHRTSSHEAVDRENESLDPADENLEERQPPAGGSIEHNTPAAGFNPVFLTPPTETLFATAGAPVKIQADKTTAAPSLSEDRSTLPIDE